MKDNTFEVKALDSDFNLIAILRYSNLQWTRKYYEMGCFSIQIPIEQYDPAMKYIYTKDRPEVGEISQVNYIDNGSTRVFALSGYFLENALNRRVAYPNGSGNILNNPSWATQQGAAEDVATEYFNAFKDVSYTQDGVTIDSILEIEAAESQGRGHEVEHTRDGDPLGNKLHEILKPSEMSYRIRYDFFNNTQVFECWKGKDRTEAHDIDVNPVTFSSAFGNLKNPNIVVSNSDYKNCYIAEASYSENNKEVYNIEAGCERKEGDLVDRFLYKQASINISDFNTRADYIAGIRAAGHEELLAHKSTCSFDFDAIEGSYEYMEDFDLGDKCSLVVKEIQLARDAVLTGCIEVIKSGEWSLSLEFDTEEE